MQKVNYQIELEKIIKQIEKEEKLPTLLLHACCAPCSSYCLEYLSKYFDITVFFYNPNIYPPEEYEKRVQEIRRFISELPVEHPVKLIEGVYDPENFYEMAKGLEEVREGGSRCFRCYKLRLKKTAELAKELGFDYFTTTLTISPLKNAQKLNEIGFRLVEEEKAVSCFVENKEQKNKEQKNKEQKNKELKDRVQNQKELNWLPSDFKKKNGYKRSIELSAEYGLYRQNYCGCEFSQKQTLNNIEN